MSAKAASISPIVVALRIWICSPMVGAACCASRNVGSAIEALAGLTSTATRAALGTSSWSSRSRLADHLGGEKIDAGCVAARPGEAGDKTEPDRVFADTEDDGDRRRRSFGRECGRADAGRGDHRHLTPDQIGHQCRYAIVLAFQPMVLDRHVLAFDGAGFVETFAKRNPIARRAIRRSGIDKSDHRQRRLLRAHGARAKQRRCRRRAAQRGQKCAPADAGDHCTFAPRDCPP